VARVLIVGCGCRGQGLARELVAAGHAVRGTTRDPARQAAIRAAGAEAHLGDPDRVATLMPALAGVTVLCWLLGSAQGSPDAVAALHGPRLAMLLERLVDTPVRGVVYEVAGAVDPAVLAAGVGVARAAQATWNIPLALLDADPTSYEAWRAAARAAIEGLLAADGVPAGAINSGTPKHRKDDQD